MAYLGKLCICGGHIVESRVTLSNYKHCEANNYYHCRPHYPSGSSRSCKRCLAPGAPSPCNSKIPNCFRKRDIASWSIVLRRNYVNAPTFPFVVLSRYFFFLLVVASQNVKNDIPRIYPRKCKTVVRLASDNRAM